MAVLILVVATFASEAVAQAQPVDGKVNAEIKWQRVIDSQSGAWAGGDATFTIPLPDGRILWLWGDSLHGEIGPKGSMLPGSAVVRNAAAIANGGKWTFVNDGALEVLPNEDSGKSWFWPLYGAAGPLRMVHGEVGCTVWLFASKERRTRKDSSDGLSFRGSGNVLFRLWIPSGGMPRVADKVVIPFTAAGTELGVLWGAGVEKVGDTLFVFGTRKDPGRLKFGKQLFLARVPFGRVAEASAWRFWNGWSWDRSDLNAVPILPADVGVSTSVSADYIANRWILVTKEKEFLGEDVIALTARNPWGPFVETLLFKSPSTSSTYTYQPSAHPELVSPPGTMMVTIDRNPVGLGQSWRHPLTYRARFYCVDIPSLSTT